MRDIEVLGSSPNSKSSEASLAILMSRGGLTPLIVLQQDPPLAMPAFKYFLKEFKYCFEDLNVSFRYHTEARTFAAMRDTDQLHACSCMDHIPAVVRWVARLVISQDEALRADVRCPNSQSRLTDEPVVHAYKIVACVTCIDNTLCLLMLALNNSI